MTALERASAERKIEGTVSLATSEAASMLFTTVLTWYRDLSWLHRTAEDAPSFSERELLHGDRLPLLEKRLAAALPPMGVVAQAFEESLQLYQRATNLHTCLEKLLLEVGC